MIETSQTAVFFLFWDFMGLDVLRLSLSKHQIRFSEKGQSRKSEHSSDFPGHSTVRVRKKESPALQDANRKRLVASVSVARAFTSEQGLLFSEKET